MFTIIIILIVVLIITAIFISAWQQNKARQDAERRAEIAKQRAITDETENVISACSSIPVSSNLLKILYTRNLNAMKAMQQLGGGSSDIDQRIKGLELQIQAGTLDNQHNEFTLPENDKLIIQYIQAVKKLRVILRSEHSKGRIGSGTFSEEDKALERLQLKVNVETLIRRGRAAMQTNMLGSARQYFEKGVKALEAQGNKDEYIVSRITALKELLTNIQDNLKNVNAADRARRKEEERDELDELFAPKKKW